MRAESQRQDCVLLRRPYFDELRTRFCSLMENTPLTSKDRLYYREHAESIEI